MSAILEDTKDKMDIEDMQKSLLETRDGLEAALKRLVALGPKMTLSKDKIDTMIVSQTAFGFNSAILHVHMHINTLRELGLPPTVHLIRSIETLKQAAAVNGARLNALLPKLASPAVVAEFRNLRASYEKLSGSKS